MYIVTDQGRTVRLKSITINDWMSHALEGTPAMISKLIRHNMALDASRHGLVIYDPGEESLPPYQCTAVLTASATFPANYDSRLYVCWFVDTLDVPIPTLVKRFVDTIIWEDVATDRSVDDL